MADRITGMTAAVALSAFLAAPAAAQQNQQTDDMAAADEAARTMVIEAYVPDTPYKTPGEVVAMLRERGYTDLHDFDVEWGNYEVEGTNPGGNDVELEIDPLTGAIVDIDDDWF